MKARRHLEALADAVANSPDFLTTRGWKKKKVDRFLKNRRKVIKQENQQRRGV